MNAKPPCLTFRVQRFWLVRWLPKLRLLMTNLARREGCWHNLLPSQVVPIHMQLLPTGKVLYWNRHDRALEWERSPACHLATVDTSSRPFRKLFQPSFKV